jgi:hypothetical protein
VRVFVVPVDRKLMDAGMTEYNTQRHASSSAIIVAFALHLHPGKCRRRVLKRHGLNRTITLVASPAQLLIVEDGRWNGADYTIN